MKSIFSIGLLMLLPVCLVEGQSPEVLHNKALDLISEGKSYEAIPLLEQAVEIDSSKHLIYLDLGYCYLSVKEYDNTVISLDRSIKIDSTHARSFVYRGYCREKLLFYDEAMQDYMKSHTLDTTDGEALFRLGLLKEKFSEKKEACKCFKRSYETGYERAKHKSERCNDSLYLNTEFDEILELKTYATNKKYGYSPKKPVMAGKGSSGGPANQRAYLDLLRDINGKPVWYERKGSCCPYKSENGLFGSALLDEYIIYYTNEDNEQVSTSIYISFYDYEEPKIPKGFKTVIRD